MNVLSIDPVVKSYITLFDLDNSPEVRRTIRSVPLMLSVTYA